MFKQSSLEVHCEQAVTVISRLSTLSVRASEGVNSAFLEVDGGLSENGCLPGGERSTRDEKELTSSLI